MRAFISMFLFLRFRSATAMFALAALLLAAGVLGSILLDRTIPEETNLLEEQSGEHRYIEQLKFGSVAAKVDATRKLKQIGSIRAVPHLLREARVCCGLAAMAVDEPDPNVAFQCWPGKPFVVVNGKKQPYIDYHEPIFNALAALSVPYAGNEREWLVKVEDWWKANDPDRPSNQPPVTINERGDIALQVKAYRNNLTILNQLARHQNTYVRERAIEWLGEAKDPSALEVLLEMARSWPNRDQRESYKSLGNALCHQNYQPTNAETAKMLEGNNLALAWFATQHIRKHRIKGLESKLCDLAERCSDQDTAWSAVNAFIAANGSSSDLHRLMKLAKDESHARQYYFVTMLTAYRKNPEVSAFFSNGLASTNSRIQAEAVHYLSREGIESPTVLKKAAGCLTSNDRGLQCATIRALEKATGRSFGSLGWPCLLGPGAEEDDNEVVDKWAMWFRINQDQLRYDRRTRRFELPGHEWSLPSREKDTEAK